MPENAFEKLLKSTQPTTKSTRSQYDIWRARSKHEKTIWGDNNTNNANTLFKPIRPRTTTPPSAMTNDVLFLIADQMLRLGLSDTLRACLSVNRAFGLAVSEILNAARQRLKVAAAKLTAVRQKPVNQLTEADRKVKRAFYREMMACGIPPLRCERLEANSERIFFHDNGSLLGHMVNGCELCRSWQSSMCRRPGPVALFSCIACSMDKRVRVNLEVDAKHDPEKFIQTRLSAEETPANNYAVRLLTKKSKVRARWVSKNPSALSTRTRFKHVNLIPVTPAMHALFYSPCMPFDVAIEDETVELWHALPAAFPPGLDFGTFMGTQSSQAMRKAAVAAQHARLDVRAKQARARRKWAKFSIANIDLVCDLNALTDGSTWAGWRQTASLCHAANAPLLRWLCLDHFDPGSQVAHAYVDDRDAARIKREIAEMPAAERDSQLKRLHTTVHVLTRVLADAGVGLKPHESDLPWRWRWMKLLTTLSDETKEKSAEHVHDIVSALLSGRLCLELVATNESRNQSWKLVQLSVNALVPKSNSVLKYVAKITLTTNALRDIVGTVQGFYSAEAPITSTRVEQLAISLNENAQHNTRARLRLYEHVKYWETDEFSAVLDDF